MKLQPNETELIGRWLVDGTGIRGDTTCERIDHLINSHLKLIATSEEWGAWETLFQDPDDGRFWERTYPEGHLQGGGPPQLRWLSIDEAKRKYGRTLDGF